MRLWVDTDVGTNPDDAIALLCALAHPDVELVGVSTADDADGARASVAQRLVGEVPVTIGSLLNTEGFGVCDPDAVLAIGPLTNLAVLVNAGEVPRQLAVMGGALAPVRHRGALRTVEHNFATDPGAAATVLERAPRVLVCPLDVTVRTCLAESDRHRLVDADDTLEPILTSWKERVCLHDPLALLALLGDPVVRTERRRLAVGPDGVVSVGEGAEHDVVIDVDAPAATARILALLDQGARYTGTPAEDERP
ncbi:MAG: nucleoside hydrolase [Acidimicrobiia bacterium]